MSHTILPLDKILVDPDRNPRKGDLDGIKELAASIQANGLLQPLVVGMVRPEDGAPYYQLIAGHRRYAALLEAGKRDAACTVIVDAENYTELALTENVMRQAMHPVDEYTAFAKLLAEGLKPKAIAKRFGLTEKGVKQRLALGSMIPEVRDLWRQDKVSDGAAKRLASASPEQQQEILAKFADRGGIDEYMVYAHLRQDRLHPDSQKVKFVGLGTYKEAGGKIGQDLFGDDKWIENTDLLDQLYEQKMESIIAGLADEGYRGIFWSKADDAPDHDTHERLYNDGTFEPEERTLIDVVVAIGYDGDTTLTFWKDKAPAEIEKPKEKAGASMMAEPNLSKSLSEDLSRVQTGFAHVYATQESNRHAVLCMLAYTLANPVMQFPLRIKANRYESTPTDRELLAQGTTCQQPVSLDWLLGLETDDVVNLIWYLAAHTLDFTDGFDNGKPETRKQWYRELVAASEKQPDWKQTAENYFKRLTKEKIIEAMIQMKPDQGNDFGTAGGLTKKGELAIIAERWAAETGWLPELLAPRLYDDAENPPGGGEVNPSIEGEEVEQLVDEGYEQGREILQHVKQQLGKMPPVPAFLKRAAAE